MINPSENRIREWRVKRGMTLEQLADVAGMSTSYLQRLETGHRNLSLKNIEKLSSQLNIPLKELLPEDQAVPLVGFVGAGAEAHLFNRGQGPLDEIKGPDDSGPNTVAVEIRGESLGSFFDRWIVFYDDVRAPPTQNMLNKLCVVGLPDGRVLIKKLARGNLPGTFTLLSQFESPIFDVHISWTAKVKTMRPR